LLLGIFHASYSSFTQPSKKRMTSHRTSEHSTIASHVRGPKLKTSSRRPAILINILDEIPHILQANNGTVPQNRSWIVLPHPFQFIIYWQSHMQRYNVCDTDCILQQRPNPDTFQLKIRHLHMLWNKITCMCWQYAQAWIFFLLRFKPSAALGLMPCHCACSSRHYLHVLTVCSSLNIFLAKIQALCSPGPDAMSLCL